MCVCLFVRRLFAARNIKNMVASGLFSFSHSILLLARPPAALLSCHRTQGISLKYSSSQQEGRKQQRRRRWRRHAVKNPLLLLLAARSKQIIKDAVKIAVAAVAEE
jgi:hypothetical protein